MALNRYCPEFFNALLRCLRSGATRRKRPETTPQGMLLICYIVTVSAAS